MGLIWMQSGVKLWRYVKSRGVEDVCEKRVLSRGLFFSFSFFFCLCYQAFIVSRYRKHHAARGIEKTKHIRQIHRPLHLSMGKSKHPESIGKVSPA